MNRLLAISFLAVLVSLNACGGGTAPAPSLNDVAQESDTGTEFTPCTKHSECTPHYCVNGYCNGTPDVQPDAGTPEPKDDVSTPDLSAPDIATSDNGTQPDAGTEPDANPPCKSNEDCNDGDACTKDQCQWGTCYYSAETCGEGQACYTSASGQKACAYVCEQDNDCAPANECYTVTCQNGFCQFATADGQECNDGNACTVNDTCTAGTCHGEAKDCQYGCNPGNGACLPACQTNNDCQDNDPCTDNTCEWGTCQTVVKAECCSELTNSCTEDNNPCTKSICNPDNSCGFEADNNATCNVGGQPGHCEAGSCWNNTPQGYCDDGDPCTDDATENGACVHSTVCADGNPCTQDSCVASGDQHTCNFEPIVDCCLTAADCNDELDCTVDTCEGLTCTHEDLCLYYDGESIARQCETDSDCSGSEFGTYCIESGEPGHSLKLCQPCYVGNDTNYGCVEGEMCYWGVLNDDSDPVNYFSAYWCEEVGPDQCETNEDCDDGNPCTIDVCGMGIDCSHMGIPGCQLCQTDDECVEDWWCDEESGGAVHRTGNCDSGKCEKMFYIDSATAIAHNCHVPIECQQDSDCPGSGECVLDLCWFPGGNWPECYLIDDGNGSATGEFCPAGQACIDNTCQPVAITTCQTDSDCVAAGLGSYCAADLETGEYNCYSCKWDDNSQPVAPGCTESQPYCMWDNVEDTFVCQTCYSDEQCGNWQHCIEGTCQGYGPVYCTFECPEANPDWVNVALFYGDDQFTEISCGTSWTISLSTLCIWGEPQFKFNLNDGQWLWDDGVNTTVTCNYPAELTPDPTPSEDNPAITMGDLGVAVINMTTLSCGF